MTQNEANQSPLSGKAFSQIELLIRARYPVLYLLTHEEARLEGFLQTLAHRQNKKLMVWTATEGLIQKSSRNVSDGAENVSLNDPIELLRSMRKDNKPALYILKDFHVFLEDPHVTRLLRDLAAEFKNSYKTILIVSPRLNLPVELEKDITLIDVPLPGLDELTALLNSVCVHLKDTDESRVNLSPGDMLMIAKAAQGLTLSEAENAYAKAAVQEKVLDARAVETVFREKEQIVRKSGMLEFHSTDLKISDVGGLDLLKDWLKVRGKAFGPNAAQFGLPSPKGVLLLGAPGCGKSLTAKAIAKYWGMPLLRLDLGKIFAGLVGSSEENMRRALLIAESIAPTVLWIDEIEKGFSGNTGSSGNSDSGTSARVFGTFLTWMQEKTANVFVVATANNIKNLPPELLRRGRFDEIFFTDLPGPTARKEILSIHLKKKRRQPEKFELDQVALLTEGYSGAELEHCVLESLFLAFSENRDIRTDDLIKTAKQTVPLSIVYAEDLKSLREWASKRARPAESSKKQEVAASAVTKISLVNKGK
jgi:ATP-dependent 26S proteasome regulatory subunit